MNALAIQFAWMYALSQLKLKYRYTFLGVLWNLIEPALFLAVLSIVFSIINKMDIADYAVFLFAALVPWRYFEKVVNACMESIVSGDWLLKKLPVSAFSLPVSRWMQATVEFSFSLVVVFAFYAFFKPTWTSHLMVLPFAIISWSIVSLGAGLIAAVLFTFFRDVKPLVQLVLMLLFFSSPILFRPDIFAEHTLQATLLQWHPLTYFAALFQKPIYFSTWPSVTDWVVTTIVGLGSVGGGYVLVQSTKKHFYFYL